MTYAANVAAISRTPITLVEVTVDDCTRTFGSTPCDATGTECYNTRFTCVFTSAYVAQDKTYRFSSAGAPTPAGLLARPYVLSVSSLPTEIKEIKDIISRVTVRLADEEDGDVGVDPYVSARSSVQGTFWKKFIARTPNYKGRTLVVKEGFLGDAIGEYKTKFAGQIETILLGRGEVVIKAEDRRADLSKILIPAKSNVELRLDATAAATDLDVVDEGTLAANDYIRINDEVIKIGSVDAAANRLSGCTRAQFGTTAAAHDAGDAVQECRYYASAKPSTQIILLMIDAGFTASEHDQAALVTIHNKPDTKLPDVEALITKPTKASELFAELLEHGEIYAYTDEGGAIKYTRRLPNYGTRSFTRITDAQNIVLHSGAVDLNDDERLTRMSVYWDFNHIGKLDDNEDFARLDVFINTDAESSDFYGEDTEREVRSRWLHSPAVDDDKPAFQRKVRNWLARTVWRRLVAPWQISLEVELKDSEIETGDYVLLSTDEILDRNGDPLSEVPMLVTKRERIGQTIKLRLMRMSPKRVCYVAPNASPDYSAADADDKQYGFISSNAPNEGFMNQENEDGYHIV